MVEILFYIAVFLGAALMVYNIIRYFWFWRSLSFFENYAKTKPIVYTAGVLLVFFLVGYILVGVFGTPDLVVAGILLGGSIFVALLLFVLMFVVNKVRDREHQAVLRYEEREREVRELGNTAVAYFRVNLTKDVVLSVGGTDLYETDKAGASYAAILDARHPYFVSRFNIQGTDSFLREDLLANFAAGHDSASEIILAKRDGHNPAFMSFRAKMAEEPSTGDVIAFIVEEDYNEKMILDTILNRAMSFRYDIVCSVIEGKFNLIASGQQESARVILPEEKVGLYGDFCEKHIQSLLSPGEDNASVMASLSLDKVAEALQHSTSYEVDVQLAYQGQIYYKRFTFYNVTSDTQFFVLLVQDTTAIHRERAEQNQKLSSALDQARHANAAKTVFFNNMSHDIRTPMNAITGFTSLALKSDDLATVKKYLEKIDISSTHLLSLINDVLEMSRIESGKIELNPQATDLNKLVNDIKVIFQTQMDHKGLCFIVEEEAVSHPSVFVDSFRLNRVLLNLLSNAYKFTPNGGTIRLSLKEGPYNANEGSYVFSVKDTGIGMSEAFAKQVFDAYARENKSTVNEIQGTGLGMAITKSIVDLMGGEIEVYTEEGKGTEFILRFVFPYAKEESGDANEEEPARPHVISPQEKLGGKRVLVADDNEINREVVEALLSEFGLVVEQAANGKEACDAIFNQPAGYYDAVLMDVQMPIMNGLEATRTIRASKNKTIAKIPIIAFTADAFDEDVQKTREAGMNAHLSKPINPEALMDTLAQFLLEEK